MSHPRGFCALLLAATFAVAATAADSWVTYEGGDGPGAGKHVVFVTGDDEYRSEESMPQLAKILAMRHGFTCTVLFAINPESGAIDPPAQNNIPGLHHLPDADLMVLFTRFRELPDDQMKYIIDYTNSGKPIIALRTATHAFNYQKNKTSPYAKWTWNSADPKGGYGREVLGETWISHYGQHNVQSTRGIIAPGMEAHPITQGVKDIWGPSDVYGVTTLAGDSKPVVLGQVLSGMKPADPPAPDKDLTPVAWLKTYTGETGNTTRVFATTMGHSYDLKSEGVRRLLVNAVYHLLDLPVAEAAHVDYVGDYDPSDIGFGTHKVGVMPEEHALKP